MKLKINIDGREYEADIEVLEEERHEPVGPGAGRAVARRPAPATGGPALDAGSVPSASDDKVCRSPIVGIVVAVSVGAGQEVSVGETLLVLEAMKMESNIVSPVAGRIKAVSVLPGESVKKGQLLVEFE
jgi:methylmalonyl-CoA carboxyltransferase small subunit